MSLFDDRGAAIFFGEGQAFVAADEVETTSIIVRQLTGDLVVEVIVRIQEELFLVSFFNSDVVGVYDETEGSIVETITVGNGPRHFESNRVSDQVYVTNQDSNTVSVIDSQGRNHSCYAPNRWST